MITYNNLWSEFASFENLYSASLKAQKGKRYKRSTLRFNFSLEPKLIQLQKQLNNNSWQPGEYWSFKIHEPKERTIHAAPYEDRIVHHALINILEPIWEKRFYDHSYACRKGKGTHLAVDICQKYMNEFKYVLKCDIKKYFPSIDREVLKNIISKKIKDKKLINVIYNIIDSSPEFEQENIQLNSINDDQLFLFGKNSKYKTGIPIGNLTSQFFANVYLNELDQWLKRECKIKGYVRYMDDFLIFHNDKAYLQTLKKDAKIFLSQKLQLDLHPNKAEIFPIKNGVTFLGYHVFNSHRRIQKSNINRFLNRMKLKQFEYANNKIKLKDITQSIKAWIGHSAHADTYHLREDLFQNLIFSKNN